MPFLSLAFSHWTHLFSASSAAFEPFRTGNSGPISEIWFSSMHLLTTLYSFHRLRHLRASISSVYRCRHLAILPKQVIFQQSLLTRRKVTARVLPNLAVAPVLVGYSCGRLINGLRSGVEALGCSVVVYACTCIVCSRYVNGREFLAACAACAAYGW